MSPATPDPKRNGLNWEVMQVDDGELNPLMFSTESGAYLAQLVANRIGIKEGRVMRKVFGDGEKYMRLDIENNGVLADRDVIVVSSTASDEDLLELIRIGCALAALGTRRRIFIIPFFGYSTMERGVLPGEIVSAKVNARLLSAIPATNFGNVFLFLDLHAAGLVHYFEGPHLRMELYCMPVLVEGIQLLPLQDEHFMFASADLGRPAWVESFIRTFEELGWGHIHNKMALIRKQRSFENTKIMNVIGDVKGYHVLIYDDMLRSGGTLLHASDAYLEAGALSVNAVISHLALNTESVVDILEKSTSLQKIVTTNSHPMSQSKKVKESKKFIIMDCSKIFASRILLSGWAAPRTQPRWEIPNNHNSSVIQS